MIVIKTILENSEKELIFDKDSIKIGRHGKNDVLLMDDAISRFHAEINRQGDAYYIRDLDSRNGITVNGQFVLEQRLQNGDEIGIGKAKLQFFASQPSTDKKQREEIDFILDDIDIPTFETVRPAVDETTELWLAKKEIFPEEEIKRMKLWYRAHRNLAELLLDTSLTFDQFLEGVMDIVAESFFFENAVILLEEQGSLVPKAHRTKASPLKSAGDRGLLVSRTIVNKVINERSGLTCTDARRDKRFSTADSVQQYDIKSVICIPLIGKENILGVIYLDSHKETNVYSEVTLEFLLHLGAEISLIMDNFLLREAKIKNEKLAAVGKTIAGLSHYIKNILLVSEGSTTLLERAIEKAELNEVKKAWKMLKENNDTLTNLVQNMLYYAKGRPRTYNSANINAIIRQVVNAIKVKLDDKGIKVTTHLANDIANSWLDDEGTYRCLLNLLINSLEALEDQAEGEIVISTEKVGDDRVVIVVQDNGSGILPEALPHIFNPFFTTKGARGTGLGLALTKRITEANGGKITCESEPGMGTTFVLTLPIYKECPPPSPETGSAFYAPFTE